MLESELYDRESHDNATGGHGAGELNPAVPAAVFQPPQVVFQPPTARPESARPETQVQAESSAAEDGEASQEAQPDVPNGGQGDGRRSSTRTRSRSRRSGAAGDGADAPAGEDTPAAAAQADGNADASAEADDEAEGPGGSGRRRRRKRRRGSAEGGAGSDSLTPDDPPDTVVHVREPNGNDDVRSVKGSTRLEAKKQRRREGRETGRRRPPIVTESE